MRKIELLKAWDRHEAKKTIVMTTWAQKKLDCKIKRIIINEEEAAV